MPLLCDDLAIVLATASSRTAIMPAFVVTSRSNARLQHPEGQTPRILHIICKRKLFKPTSAHGVVATYKPPMLVPRVRFPVGAFVQKAKRHADDIDTANANCRFAMKCHVATTTRKPPMLAHWARFPVNAFSLAKRLGLQFAMTWFQFITTYICP